MKILITMMILLTGCASQPQSVQLQTVVEYRNVFKIPPVELFSVPPVVYTLNLSQKPTDVQIADWLIANEKRTNQMELQLIELSDFYRTVLTKPELSK